MALTFRSIDTMKTSRDNNSTTNAAKIAHINAIIQAVPDLTHIAIGCYQNNFSYQSISYINEWFDAVHNAGKKVFFRPALTAQMPSYAVDGDLATTVDDYIEIFKYSADQYNWSDGDAWDVIPESGTTSAMYNTKYGLGNPASWNAGVREFISELQGKFTTLNKDVDVTFWSGTDQQAVFQTQLEQATVDVTGKVCIDFYPMDIGSMRAKIASCISQLARAHTNYPTADIYITEIGYNNTTLVGDEDQRTLLRHFFNELSTIPYVKGLNYWHAAGDATYDKCHLFVSQSTTTPRPSLYMLGELYSKGRCSGRVHQIP